MQKQHIYLKKLEVNDCEFLFNLFQHKEYAELFYEEATTLKDWENRICRIKSNTNLNQFIIKENVTNKSVGWVGHFQEDENVECLQILIIAPSYLRHGYGTEVINILKNSLSNKGRKKIRLSTQDTNKRAQSFYFKNHFSITGTCVEEVDGGNKLENFVIMECTL